MIDKLFISADFWFYKVARPNIFKSYLFCQSAKNTYVVIIYYVERET